MQIAQSLWPQTDDTINIKIASVRTLLSHFNPVCHEHLLGKCKLTGVAVTLAAGHHFYLLLCLYYRLNVWRNSEVLLFVAVSTLAICLSLQPCLLGCLVQMMKTEDNYVTLLENQTACKMKRNREEEEAKQKEGQPQQDMRHYSPKVFEQNICVCL